MKKIVHMVAVLTLILISQTACVAPATEITDIGSATSAVTDTIQSENTSSRIRWRPRCRLLVRWKRSDRL